MRRRALITLPLLLSACGLAERPYAQRREWPLLVRRADMAPPSIRGPVLELRSMRAGPGMEARGLQSVQSDGSIRTAFYEEWATPPAQAVESSLRGWLIESGLFSAVVGQGSRLAADLSLESELDALWTTVDHAHASVTVALIDVRPATAHVLLQRTIGADAPLGGHGVQGSVDAQMTVLGAVFRQVEMAIAAIL